jgi:hypothetical protein
MNRPDQKPFPPRPIDATLHGATDYTVGTLLTTVFPKLAGIEGTPSARQIRTAGAVHAGYSTLTDYPLGIVKVLPYKAHLAIDAVGALALAATPFVTGQYTLGRRQWLPHLGLCLFELSSLLMTDPTGRGDDHSDVERVREANASDPDVAIRRRGLAVVPASAERSHPAAAG